MRFAIVAAMLLAGISSVSAQNSGLYGSSHSGGLYGGGGVYGTGSNPSSHYVQPYYRSNGTYVGGHYQTNPNNTQLDNYGTRGNYNPYTGTYGTRTPHY
jgi:hypothetical protein